MPLQAETVERIHKFMNNGTSLFNAIIDDDGAKYLAKCIQSSSGNSNISCLFLADNRIGDEGARYLAEVLNGFNITEFNVFNNKNIGDVGVGYLAGNLKSATKLERLNLGANNIGAIGAISLAEGLNGSNCQLLSLSCNNIGSNGAKCILEALQYTNIHYLCLESNNIGDSGLGTLQQNSNLSFLDLSYNHIGQAGAKYIANLIQNSTKLRTLWLSNNKLGPAGVRCIAKVLKQNITLEYLDLSGNCVGDDEMRVLGMALRESNVRTLNVSNNKISVDCMAEALKGTNITSVPSNSEKMITVVLTENRKRISAGALMAVGAASIASNTLGRVPIEIQKAIYEFAYSPNYSWRPSATLAISTIEKSRDIQCDFIRKSLSQTGLTLFSWKQARAERCQNKGNPRKKAPNDDGCRVS